MLKQVKFYIFLIRSSLPNIWSAHPKTSCTSLVHCVYKEHRFDFSAIQDRSQSLMAVNCSGFIVLLAFLCIKLLLAKLRIGVQHGFAQLIKDGLYIVGLKFLESGKASQGLTQTGTLRQVSSVLNAVN